MSVNSSQILKDATQLQLEQAAAHNHRELFLMNAIAQRGEVQTREGISWTYTDANNLAMVPFPSLPPDQAGMRLDEMMNWYRAHPPKGAVCWSLDPPQPADLGVRLLARGFQPGWLPGWMALDLQKIQTGYPTPSNLEVYADNETDIEYIKNLPYAGDNGAISEALIKTHPERTQRFIARLDGKIVAHCAVFLNTDGPYAVAGIYNVGCVPDMRNLGIGKAVVTTASLYAKEEGYRYALLNGTGRRMYEQIGFKFLGYGNTWFLANNRFITHPPSAALVAFAEAIGNGSTTILNDAARPLTIDELNIPLNNGMTPMQLAMYCKQPATCEWLIQHGVAYTVLDAWDMGWQDRAAALLKTDPAQTNRQYGDWKTTLLHIAAQRNDVTLAKVAITANPDLTIKDANYNSTALDWAIHLQRLEIAALIKSVM